MDYFETLNKDLLMIVLSKTSGHTFGLIQELSYNIKILSTRDENYEYLLMYSNPDLYKFIKNIKNIDGSDSWYNTYQFFKIFSVDREYDIQLANYYHSNLFYLYKIKIQYPKIYLHAKNINLDHCGFLSTVRGTICWSQIYNLLNTHPDYKTNFQSYKILDGGVSSFDSASSIFYYILFMEYLSDNPSKTHIKNLFDMFAISFDIYQLAIDSMSPNDLLSIINDKSTLDKILGGQLGGTYNHCAKIFYRDLDRQLKLK